MAVSREHGKCVACWEHVCCHWELFFLLTADDDDDDGLHWQASQAMHNNYAQEIVEKFTTDCQMLRMECYSYDEFCKGMMQVIHVHYKSQAKHVANL